MPAAVPPHLTAWLTPALESIRNGSGKPCLTGLHGSTAGFALTLLMHAEPPGGTRAPDQSWLIITGTAEQAEGLFDDLRSYHALFGLSQQGLVLFPKWETLPYESSAPHVELVARRMRALQQLCDKSPTKLVTSVPALIQRLLPLDVFQAALLKLATEEAVERDLLLSRLLRLGYRRTSVVEIPGEFSIRGGIVDLFSTAYPDPLRLELLGDTLESIRLFDPATQKSTQTLREAWVLPAREAIRPGDDPEAMSPVQPDAEWHAPLLYQTMACLLDYFAQAPLLVFDQPHALKEHSAESWKLIEEGFARHQTRAGGEPYPEPDHLYLRWDDLLDQASSRYSLALEPIAAPDQSWSPVVACPTQTPASIGLGLRGTGFSQTLDMLEQLRQDSHVLLVARSQGQVGRLLALFAEHDLPAAEWTPSAWTVTDRKTPFYVLHSSLTAGFVSSELRLTILTEEELFAKAGRHKPPPKTKTATFLSSLEDLNTDDYVVHVQHGIAKYRGLKRLSVQGFDSDYLVLEFAREDKLYVPLDRLNQVQRYTGAEGHVPRLDRLGGTTWAKTTARIKKDIEEMAHELIDLYASRELVQRSSYGQDSTLLHEFEAAFEYEETPDQLRAIEDIKRDMRSDKPMDRLVCGDVGYGKTEVSMRAAFKAIEENRQVAVLAPTTLLAHQHYETFAERFAPFPTRVALLSRFQSPKETGAILKDLAAGTIDVVIGTHRLLQSDVHFRSLGLVIIDEEQWFGVRHKERLKQLRTQVDVLTLTATPIPRTLQMALSSVRDLSIIDTPPPGRLAIRTEVVRYDEKLIREAILRELGRGGQTYFVHNRVETMERMGTQLRNLVPEARIVMAHGQMDTKLLESVMLKFFHHEADVLVASAIIQSGLDVPSANTIIVNRADTFGLSQLYQLRGRVGRGGEQAFAYLLIPDEGTLTGDAQKRLTAIQQFTELGSGFRIAAADLEIRGAGNLLGKQQSGHIAAIGLDLYMQMMEQAVQRLKGHVVEEEPDPVLQLHVSAYIPEDYVPDSHQRLSLYKRLSSCRQLGDLALLHGEVQDRYGRAPEAVERLFEVMELRLSAQSLRVVSIVLHPAAVVVTLDQKTPVAHAAVHRLMDQLKTRLRFLSPLSFEVSLPQPGWATVFPEINGILQTLKLCDTTKPSS